MTEKSIADGVRILLLSIYSPLVRKLLSRSYALPYWAEPQYVNFNHFELNPPPRWANIISTASIFMRRALKRTDGRRHADFPMTDRAGYTLKLLAALCGNYLFWVEFAINPFRVVRPATAAM